MNILFLDDELVLVNKPAGLLSIQDGYQPQLPNLKRLLEIDLGKVYTVHRLDKETSGVIVFARSPYSHKVLNSQFENREVQKTYLAHVHSQILESYILIDFPLLVNGDRRHRTTINPVKGKAASTEVQLLDHVGSGSLLQVHPKTGYTHQIRAHLSAIGHPIFGDTLYGEIENVQGRDKLQKRLQLHAYRIQFIHPTLGVPLNVLAPIPDDLPEIKEYIK